MQVTTEDGGRLNAFAKEPRMEVVSEETSRSNGSRLMIIGGSVLVVALMAVTVAIS
ncbi:photosystem II assembly protein Psb34 [Synechococcus sp. NOUM97013]|uniref:photosystem II assembly protein Psb34 n=1 Tax=Synechococcus sp. NOUM97013 TaxID=1442555 RepID=UPI0016462C27|nr:ssl1498 family light-harvesting-like protein [Synechococcus sp. NOUM97013]QNI72153.1 high ligh-induced protein family [Synechococcus sp. NOUM97013]